MIPVPHVTRADLARTFAAYGYRYGAEIGTERGLYAEVLCQANPGLRLMCVDAWKAYKGYREHVTQAKLDGFYAETQARLAPYGCACVRAFSVEAAQNVSDGSLDFIYLDANHTYPQVEADLHAWVPKVRRGGMVAGHDFCRRKNMDFGVIEAVTNYTNEHSIDPWWVLTGDNSPSWAWVN